MPAPMGTFAQTLAHITGGRRYCFVIMTYHGQYTFFERIREIVARETAFECIRADDIPRAGEDLRPKIHAAIDSAALVIADISHLRPNIYYEIGYAVARGKPLLLQAQDKVKVPTDLVGVELIRYSDTQPGLVEFERSLREHLRPHADSNIGLLRAMIVPSDPEPTYILLNPKQMVPESLFRQHPFERRTYGDYLGVRGVLTAFASVYGEFFTPEIILASLAPKDLAEADANFYLIGSFKSNPFTTHFLDALQRGRGPNWRFAAGPGQENIKDFEVQLSGTRGSRPWQTPFGRPQTPDPLGGIKDYGLIIRGPHPKHPRRLVTIMAGPHSLGTGAACLAATRSEHARRIGELLVGQTDLGARDQTIWVLVKGMVGTDFHLSSAGVRVLAAGVYS